jgi:hypothetical protein
MGHYGPQSICLTLWSKGFWWPQLHQDCLRETQNCLTCLKFSAKRVGYHPLKSITSFQAGDHWSIDLIVMPDGHILTIVDIATGFGIFKACKNKKNLEQSHGHYGKQSV